MLGLNRAQCMQPHDPNNGCQPDNLFLSCNPSLHRALPATVCQPHSPTTGAALDGGRVLVEKSILRFAGCMYAGRWLCRLEMLGLGETRQFTGFIRESGHKGKQDWLFDLRVMSGYVQYSSTGGHVT